MKKDVFLIVGIVVFVFFVYYIFGQMFNEDPLENIDNPEFVLNSLENSLLTSLSELSESVIYLSELKSLQNYLDGEGVIEDVYLDFLFLGEEQEEYHQIRYLDETGFERVRVDYDKNKFVEISGGDLQDKSSRYYFVETMQLDKGEVYVSQLDLNIEENVVENVGTMNNPKYIPMIRYATPVFDSAGERRGIVILNIHAVLFLDYVREIEGMDNVYLLNQDGFYLSHNEMSKEYGFMFENEITFFNDYSFSKDFFLSSLSLGVVEKNGLRFLFEVIRPDYLANEAYAGSQHFDRERYWVLVIVV